MQLTLTLPDELAANFADEERLRRTLLEDFVIEQRQAGVISLGRAAELIGLSDDQYFALLGSKGLSFINATPEEGEESYEAFTRLMNDRQ